MPALLFCLTILLSSFLLFMVQPLVGRMLLPSLGGTPAVWNTCVVFFQAVLLAGYGYTHYVSSRLKPRNQVILHFILLGFVCFALPIRMFSGVEVPTDSDPTLWLLLQLCLMVGLPFFVISSNAPLLQRWYSYVLKTNADNPKQKNSEPYWLYAVSNIGSLTALLAYPFLIEPSLGISGQALYWLIAFLLLVVGFLGCGWIIFNGQISDENHNPKKIPSDAEAAISASDIWKQRLHWIALAAIPSSLMLGVTTYLTIDVGSLPLLWVIPLALYLLTFVFAFASREIIPHRLMIRATPVLVLLMALLLLVDLGSQPLLIAPFHLITFFVIAMMCHGELNRNRPPVDRLTEFYLMLSIGGFVGGMFNAFIAPNLFNEVWEYPVALVAACLLMPNAAAKVSRFTWSDFAWPVGIALFGFIAISVTNFAGIDNKGLTAAILFGIPGLICYGFVNRPVRFGLTAAVIIFSCQLNLTESDVIVAERGFFGVNKVTLDEEHGFRVLINGRTMHGIQHVNPKIAMEPLSYFHRTGPMGDVFRVAKDELKLKDVGVIGLGTGSLAGYAEAGQNFDFYEIDPLVCKFASDPNHFSFLSNAKGNCNLIVGDARVCMQRNELENPQITNDKYDLFVLDAFSSDAIPMHLVTLESFELYDRYVKEAGMLAMNITNKHLDLRPLIEAIAEANEWTALIREDLIPGDHTDNNGKLSSIFVVLTRNPACIQNLQKNSGWKILESEKKIHPWTDEFSNYLDVVAW